MVETRVEKKSDEIRIPIGRLRQNPWIICTILLAILLVIMLFVKSGGSTSTSISADQAGKSVIGYRAPGFSITPQTEWAFDILANHGFKYDSSIFPGKRDFGHYNSFNKEPVIVKTASHDIIEFPQTLFDFGLFKFSCFGGGYFRLFPGFFIKILSERIINNNKPLIIYMHPRDMDINQPKFHFPLVKKIRFYINISKTGNKLDNITRYIHFKSFETVLSDASFMESLQQYNIKN